MKREKEEKKARDAKVAMKAAKKQRTQDSRNAKSASAGNSRPSQSNVTQQPGRAAQTQSTEELHSADVFNSSTAPIIAATSAGATCWTRFRSAVCCMSTQNVDGHH
jgi:outer membrane biosynthesis protein TonB